VIGFLSTSQATSRGKPVRMNRGVRAELQRSRRRQYDLIVAAIKQSPAGLTADAIDDFYGWDATAHAGRRIVELVRMGEIVRLDEKRMTRSGKPAYIHVLPVAVTA